MRTTPHRFLKRTASLPEIKQKRAATVAIPTSPKTVDRGFSLIFAWHADCHLMTPACAVQASVV